MPFITSEIYSKLIQYDDKELMELIHKWDNLLNKKTRTDDKILQKVIEENCK